MELCPKDHVGDILAKVVNLLLVVHQDLLVHSDSVVVNINRVKQ